MTQKVQISLRNSPAQPWLKDGDKPDKKSIIIAEIKVPDATEGTSNTAQLQFDGKDASDVYFINSDDIISTDNTMRVELTGKNTVEVKFTARKALEAIIEGYLMIGSQMLPNSSDRQNFTFEVEPDELELDIEPAEIYLGDKITAKARVLANEVPVSGQFITLDLKKTGPATFKENNSKYQVSDNGYTVLGATGDDGYLEVEIQANKWGADELTMSLYEGTDGHLADITKAFDIKPPKDVLLDLVMLSPDALGEKVACGGTGQDKTFLYHGYAAADGIAEISLHGFLGSKTDNTKNYSGQEVQITILGKSVFNPIQFTDKDNSIDETGKIATLTTDSQGKTPTLTISSSEICSELIQITNTSIGYTRTLNFSFFDPWTDVASVHATFITSPKIKNRIIFANGNHFAGLQVLIQPKSPNINLSLTADTIRDNIFLIDNITGVKLGEDQFKEWYHYPEPPNDRFGTAVNDTGQEIFEEKNSDETDVSPSINFYITSKAFAAEKGETDSFTFGLRVCPTGKSIIKAQPFRKDRYGNFLGTALPKVAPIDFRKNGDVNLDPDNCPAIRTIKERVITGNDLEIKLNQVKDPFQNDFCPAKQTGPDHENNYWRWFNFEATLNKNVYSNPTSRLAYLTAELNNYPVGVNAISPNALVIRDLYCYSCYLWPFNISDKYPPKGIPFPQMIDFNGPCDKKKSFKTRPVEETIYFSWYANFCFLNDQTNIGNDVQIYGYDQYGNKIDILFSPGTLPIEYESSGDPLKNWNPFTQIKVPPSDLTNVDQDREYSSLEKLDNYSKPDRLYINVDVSDNGEFLNLTLTLGPLLADWGWSAINAESSGGNNSTFVISGGPINESYPITDSTYQISTCGFTMEPAKYRYYGDESTLWIAGALYNYYDETKINLIFSPIWHSSRFAIYSTAVNNYYYCLKNGASLMYAGYPIATNASGASRNFEFYASPV